MHSNLTNKVFSECEARRKALSERSEFAFLSGNHELNLSMHRFRKLFLQILHILWL